MEDWRNKAKQEKMPYGDTLPEGDTTIILDDIQAYERVEDEYEGRPTLRFLITFQNPEKASLYIPASAFKKLQEAIDLQAHSIRITRQGVGQGTKYTTIINKEASK